MQTNVKTEGLNTEDPEQYNIVNYNVNFNFYENCGVKIDKIEISQTGKPDPETPPPGGK